MKTPMTKLMLAAAAATLLCLGAKADTHDAVQLWEGGPYWAECNVGATKPEEYGYYFWWGDTVGYRRENNAWVASDDSTSNFSFLSGNAPTYGKNNATLLSEGYIDSTGNLVAAHDAAQAHWGGGWRMPTDAEINALINNCTTTWITTNGVNGRLVTGKGAYADRSIFLPATGYGVGEPLNNPGSCGNYWSSTPHSGDSDRARFFYLASGDFYQNTFYRFYGQAVRPVCDSADTPESVEQGLTQDADGYYLLGSVQDWKDFAALIEETPTVNAKMVADIDLGDDQTHIGSITEGGYLYKGVFDGQGHTLTVAYVGAANQIVAPFTILQGACLKNLHIAGTIETSYAYCGAVGWADSGTCVSNIWMSANITSHQTGWVSSSSIVGAVGGENLIVDCLFTGSYSGSEYRYTGCFLGSNYNGTASIINCLSVGTFNIGDSFYGTYNNCYVQQFAADIPATMRVSEEQLANGTIATALQAGREVEVWEQNSAMGHPMLRMFGKKETITWLDDAGEEIGTTEAINGSVPVHAEPTKAAEAPYRWDFTGWSPVLGPAVSNTTYTATFRKIADLALVTNNWTAADGDEIEGTTTYKVTIPGGATVTINGVSVTGVGGGAMNLPPAFAAGGKAATTEFVQGTGGKWTLTTFAELSNDAVGADVAAEQIKVYAADSVEGLESASPMTEGVTVKEKKSAVKTTIEVTPPDPTATAQFFKVEFGE